MAPPPDLSALLRAADTDPAARNAVLAAVRPYLHGVLYHAPGLAEAGSDSDIVQEALLTIHQKLGQFHGTSAREFLAWAARIVRNGAVTQKRKRRLHVAADGSGLDQVAAPNPADNPLYDPELGARLTFALEQLPEHERRVLEWRCSDKLPFAEIGRRLERSEVACRVVFIRAVNKLRVIMGGRQ
jgi:RNA polymerase sigma-70 factor (ECF subfamily)